MDAVPSSLFGGAADDGASCLFLTPSQQTGQPAPSVQSPVKVVNHGSHTLAGTVGAEHHQNGSLAASQNGVFRQTATATESAPVASATEGSPENPEELQGDHGSTEEYQYGPWVQDYTVDGHAYWFNYDTGESSWYAPDEVRSLALAPVDPILAHRW